MNVTPTDVQQTRNLLAFLEMLAWSEIGPELIQVSDEGYNVIVGSTFSHPILFTDYSKHPQIYNPQMNSDAAGKWQFMGKYWEYYKAYLGLPDFGKDSQQKWAIQLILECKALSSVYEGNIALAITQCSSRWASLPGNNYGQHKNLAAELIDQYRNNGGVLE